MSASRVSETTPPPWARAVDFVCLGLLILALVVTISGGFRIYPAGLRLSLTSPSRLLLWAVALGLARHFLAAPAIPAYRDLPARLARYARAVADSSWVVPDIVPQTSVTPQPSGL